MHCPCPSHSSASLDLFRLQWAHKRWQEVHTACQCGLQNVSGNIYRPLCCHRWHSAAEGQCPNPARGTQLSKGHCASPARGTQPSRGRTRWEMTFTSLPSAGTMNCTLYGRLDESCLPLNVLMTCKAPSVLLPDLRCYLCTSDLQSILRGTFTLPWKA